MSTTDNLHRRHLSVSQRGMVATRMKAYYAKAAKERQLAGQQSGGRGHKKNLVANLPPSLSGTARDQAGAALGVSGRTVEHGVQVLSHGVPDDELIFGQRRLKAVKQLGWDRVSAVVVNVSSIVAGEYAENEIRKQFTYSEQKAIADAVAKEMGKRLGRPSKNGKESTAHGPDLSAVGETRELAAKKAGFRSAHTYRDVSAVVDRGAPEVVKAMDDGLLKPSAAAKLVDANLAQRARDYAKAAGLGLQVANQAKRIELDARRKIGNVLFLMKANGQLAERGGDQKSNSQRARLITLDDLGLTYSQSSRYQQEAAVPEEVYRPPLRAFAPWRASRATRASYLSCQSRLRPLALRLARFSPKRQSEPSKAVCVQQRGSWGVGLRVSGG